MGTKHTPGPWEVMAGDNFEIRSPLMPREYPHQFKDDSTGDFVAYIGNHAADFGEANARLIAAAPELFELVRTANDALCGSHTVSWQRKATEAVANVLGHNGEGKGREHSERPA